MLTSNKHCNLINSSSWVPCSAILPRFMTIIWSALNWYSICELITMSSILHPLFYCILYQSLTFCIQHAAGSFIRIMGAFLVTRAILIAGAWPPLVVTAVAMLGMNSFRQWKQTPRH
jgi:hypothetical protein